MVEHGGAEIGWPTAQHQVRVFNTTEQAVGFGEVFDARATFCWLHRDALLKALDRECDAASDDNAALTDAVRQKQLATIGADYLATERAEAEICWMAQERGFPIAHRPDTDARALLALDLVVGETPASSDKGGHATRFVGVPR
jgi:hypothetical protein